VLHGWQSPNSPPGPSAPARRTRSKPTGWSIKKFVKTARRYRTIEIDLAGHSVTAVDDGVISRNPCRIKEASVEPTPERPVATVDQVLEIAWKVPPAFRAFVLLGTFASLRWGELVALQRKYVDLDNRVVRVVAAYNELSTGEMLLGPPKTAAGLRRVALPSGIIPVLRQHLAEFSAPGPDGLVFVGAKGGPLRRSNFSKLVDWRGITEAVGLPGLRFHDLRHTGNTLAEVRVDSDTARPPLTCVPGSHGRWRGQCSQRLHGRLRTGEPGHPIHRRAQSPHRRPAHWCRWHAPGTHEL
jgi:integrase